MKIRFLAAATAAAASVGLAIPAAAQNYYPYPQPTPQYQYPQQAYPQQYGQPGYGQNPVGAIINQLLGNRYSVTDRTAVSQCAAAAMNQAAAQYGQRGYSGYNHGYGQQQYGYNPASMMRVTAITNVERRQNGLRVTGLMASGAYGHQGYAYGNQGYADPRYANRGNLSFRCNVDYRGAVTNIRIRRA